jgi:EmrB/QacA subfamily drug resistance transporter
MINTISRRTQIITLVVCCLGTFMVLLDSSIVTLALPTIQASLHASLADLQWTVDAYTLSFAALLLTAGTLGDRFGRKRLFMLGLILFLLGSTFCAFAPTFSWLLFGRVAQGVGGALLTPGSLSVLASAFPEPRSRAKVIGLWSGISGIALAAGPLVGGLLIQFGNWPAIFLVNLPVGLIALILGGIVVVESRNPAAQRIDLPGQVLVIGGLTCLIMGLIESSVLGWTSPLILALFGGAIVLLTAFFLVEARVREPLLPLGLFKNPVFSVANLASLVLGGAVLATVFFVAQYFQSVQGYTALETGLLTLPITMGTFLSAPFGGRLTARSGPRLPIIVGTLLAAGGMFLLTDLQPTSSYAGVWWKLAMLGIGFGFMLPALTIAVFSSTPAARTGLASSLASTSRQVGVTLGIALLGDLVIQLFASNIVSQLVQRGVPSAASAAIASTVASAGAQASQIPLTGKLPVSPEILHQIIELSFVDALHESFLITGIVLFVTSLLVIILFPRKKRSTEKSVAPTDSRVADGELAESSKR